MTGSLPAYVALAVLVLGHLILKAVFVRIHRIGRPALSDFGHMVLPEEIRANGHRVPPKISRFLFP